MPFRPLLLRPHRPVAATLWRLRRPAKSGRAPRVLITLGVLLLLFGIALAILVNRTRPTLTLLAKAQVREHVLRAVNNAVSDEITDGGAEYGEFVTLERDYNGDITALVLNSAKMNLLQARVSNRVAVSVLNLVNTDMGVQFGDLTGNVMFAGRGPALPVRVQSVNDVTVRVINEVSDYGINQTHYKLALEVSTEISILIPGGTTTATVVTEIAIAESVIIGKVPQFYAK
ncbi:MAG: sporulation protein YunB [Oscillospiraceae bacterium]|jgi:sporulation protein YunB|nr:sporulation protein YunB [Oscillospiraceae bacterium]